MASTITRSWLLTSFALVAATCIANQPPTDRLCNLPLSQLDQRLTEIDAELAPLARYSIRSGTGGIGYRSTFHTSEDAQEWVTIDFSAAFPLDEVILVPVVRRDAKAGFQADGFPRQFRLIAGTDQDLEGQVIATFTDGQNFLPRIAPLSIPCNGISVSWIRIETDLLSLRDFDERYVFQLSEIMAFSGDENVALHQLVQSKSNRRDGLAWDERFLVDGFVPYLMDAASGEKSVAFISRFTTNIQPTLTIDLGETQAVSRLHLHAVDPSDVLPQSLPSDFGIPKKMRLEGAKRPDFSDAETLLDIELSTIYDMAPVMMWPFPETTNRYFRLSILAPAIDPLYGPLAPRFGFAEIELISKGKNIARGKTITGTEVNENPNRPISQLTDGRNMYGSILPARDWMRQLTQRHNLEKERPLVAQELNRRYERQKANLRRMGWLSALLTVGIGFTILIDRILRMRQVHRIELRIAADLHDELGANLHTIGLLSDLADDAKDEPDELGMLLQRIRAVTERSGVAVRNCTNMHQSDDLYKGLVEDMQRAALRITDNRDHDFAIEGEEYLDHFKQRTCFGLFLFYKECLINISRHADATKISTRLRIQPRRIDLTISDNGRGLSDTTEKAIPPSLRRRARLLGATVTFENPPNGGTSIKLTVQKNKRRRCK